MKIRHPKFKTRLSMNGMSLIELLTSVMIIGIATAGTMELAYVNAFWAANGMNKADNLYVARRFLDILSRDLRNAANLTASPDGKIVKIYRSPDLSQASGFSSMTNLIAITYNVAQDPNSTDLAATDYLITRQEGSGQPVTILSGLVGPVSTSGSSLQIFQYSSATHPSGTTDGLSPTILNQSNSVVVNLELKKVNFDSATAAMNSKTNHSFEAIRSEIFCRNSNFGSGM